jgi:hypothetical protein
MRTEYLEVRWRLNKTVNLIIICSTSTSKISEYRIFSVKIYLAPQVPKFYVQEPRDLVNRSPLVCRVVRGEGGEREEERIKINFFIKIHAKRLALRQLIEHF